MAKRRARRSALAVHGAANRGIGHKLAARQAEHGLTVVLTVRDGEREEAPAAPFLVRGLAVIFRRLDVSNEEVDEGHERHESPP